MTTTNLTSTNHSPLPTLLACAVVGFLFTLAIYMMRGGEPSTRIGYAVFVSVLPALLTWPIAAWWRLSRKWAIVVYAILFSIDHIHSDRVEVNYE